MAKSVLLVDDDALVLTVHRSFLTQLNFIVDEVQTGQSAINKVTENCGKYDLILMDYNLPDFKGHIVAREIRRLEANSLKPLIIFGITAHTNHVIRRACLLAGMDEIISKPLLVDKLNALLYKHLVFHRKEPA